MSAARLFLFVAVSVLAVGPLGGCTNTEGEGPAASSSGDAVPPHETFTIFSKRLGEDRVINVYTPPPPGAQDATSPFVLYMLDGGLKEDFPHIAGTIDELVRAGAIPRTIVVGIENTQRRRDLTGPTEVEEDRKVAPVVGGAEAFRGFIRDELIPEVDRRYPSSGERGLVGESVAGLFTVETFLLEPDLFHRYIAMDPSLWWNGHRLVQEAADRLSQMAIRNRVLWFTASDATDIVPHADKLASALKASAPTSLRWTYDPRPNEHHHTIFRATKEAAFRWALR